MYKLIIIYLLKIFVLSMGVIFSFIAAKLKLFSDDIQTRIADWSVTYTLAILAFISAKPSAHASEEYIILFKSVVAIITGAVLTILKLVIEYLFNKYVKKNK